MFRKLFTSGRRPHAPSGMVPPAHTDEATLAGHSGPVVAPPCAITLSELEKVQDSALERGFAMWCSIDRKDVGDDESKDLAYDARWAWVHLNKMSWHTTEGTLLRVEDGRFEAVPPRRKTPDLADGYTAHVTAPNLPAEAISGESL